MRSENEETLEVYQETVDLYLRSTPTEVDKHLESWLTGMVTGLPADAHIFEIGSGGGRDALYLQSLGYTVQCSDAIPGFVEALQKVGLNAVLFNALTDEYPAGLFDLVFADAVLLHFTVKEFRYVIRKVYGTLNKDGRFAFTMKVGEGNEWSNAKLNAPRFFQYWRSGSLKTILDEAGFQVDELDESSPGWLHVVTSKK